MAAAHALERILRANLPEQLPIVSAALLNPLDGLERIGNLGLRRRRRVVDVGLHLAHLLQRVEAAFLLRLDFSHTRGGAASVRAATPIGLGWLTSKTTIDDSAKGLYICDLLRQVSNPCTQASGFLPLWYIIAAHHEGTRRPSDIVLHTTTSAPAGARRRAPGRVSTIGLGGLCV